ncbi:MAG: TlpA family protein disulfide reductase [Holosporaceae bacterium]|jgi:thiol-disulfide isomerase/thioredoxin|nr:TlpA family protein disulfide reductase [Holosporaceae bacterium]
MNFSIGTNKLLECTRFALQAAMLALWCFQESEASGVTDPSAAIAMESTAAFDFRISNGGDEKDFCLADLKGSVVVVVFFTTWCPNCPMILQQLDQLAAEKLGGLKIIALNIGSDHISEIKKHYAQHHLTQLTAYSSVAIDMVGSIRHVPTCLVFDRKGILAREYSCDHSIFDAEDLKKLAENLLKAHTTDEKGEENGEADVHAACGRSPGIS